MSRIPRVYVIVAAYNEVASVGTVLRELVNAGYRVVVVDDGSTDGTWNAVRLSGVVRLRHCVNRGQGASLQTGILAALQRDAEYIVTFDADGQHLTRDIELLLKPLVAGECDIALGSRFMGTAVNIPWARRITLRLGVLFTGITSGVWLTDTHNGLRAFNANVARCLNLTLDRMAHASEIVHKIRINKLRYKEVGVTVQYTSASLAKGQSNSEALMIALRFLSTLVNR